MLILAFLSLTSTFASFFDGACVRAMTPGSPFVDLTRVYGAGEVFYRDGVAIATTRLLTHQTLVSAAGTSEMSQATPKRPAPFPEASRSEAGLALRDDGTVVLRIDEHWGLNDGPRFFGLDDADFHHEVPVAFVKGSWAAWVAGRAVRLATTADGARQAAGDLLEVVRLSTQPLGAAPEPFDAPAFDARRARAKAAVRARFADVNLPDHLLEAAIDLVHTSRRPADRRLGRTYVEHATPLLRIELVGHRRAFRVRYLDSVRVRVHTTYEDESSAH